MNRELVAYRNLLKINQHTMCKELNISSVSYSHKETGKKQFTQIEMVKITKLFKKYIPDITMDDIFFNDVVTKLETKIAK